MRLVCAFYWLGQGCSSQSDELSLWKIIEPIHSAGVSRWEFSATIR